MPTTTDYRREAAEDAADTIREFADEILEQLLDKGEASDDLLNDYSNGDAWHHECHTDKDYDLQEAAAILDQLSEHEETDNGLWEGLEPRRAIAAQAAYTYANAVYSEWRDLIEKINDDAADIISDYDEKIEEIMDLEGDYDERVQDAEILRDEKREALEALITEAADNA